MALETFELRGFLCRRAAMRNLTHRGREDRSAYTLCQQEDGDWIFVSESALIEAARADAAAEAAAEGVEALEGEAGKASTPPPAGP